MKVLSFLFVLCSSTLFGQSYPSLLIDNVSTQFSDVSLPYWLKSGQTINLGTNAQSVSILEFNVNGNNLEFSQAISLKTSQTVPDNKVWKIEAIGLKESNILLPSSFTNGINNTSSTSNPTNVPTVYQSPKKFEDAGTYKWKVPPGVTSICVEVWGAGGGGGGSFGFITSGGGGGGGGYAYQCFTVVSGTEYDITVGAGGSGGICGGSGGGSSLGNLISASGGRGGVRYIVDCGGLIDFGGGIGGNSSNTFNSSGNNGKNGYEGGSGGGGANGGAGGPSGLGIVGKAPGGGGGGGMQNPGVYSTQAGGAGARGQVYIYW